MYAIDPISVEVEKSHRDEEMLSMITHAKGTRMDYKIRRFKSVTFGCVKGQYSGKFKTCK